jgi:hypothetical protein
MGACIADSCAGVAAALLLSAAPAPLPWLPQLIRLGAGEEEWLLPLLLPPPPSPRPGEPGRGGGAGGLLPPPPPPPCCKYQGFRNMAKPCQLSLRFRALSSFYGRGGMSNLKEKNLRLETEMFVLFLRNRIDTLKKHNTEN